MLFHLTQLLSSKPVSQSASNTHFIELLLAIIAGVGTIITGLWTLFRVLSKIEVNTAVSAKAILEHDEEIDSLRKSRHEAANFLTILMEDYRNRQSDRGRGKE